MDSSDSVPPSPTRARLAAETAPSQATPSEMEESAPLAAFAPEPELRPTSNGLPSRATNPKLAMPVRLGAVMIQLLKSYGITDDEIAQGLAAFAAKSGLSRAG